MSSRLVSLAILILFLTGCSGLRVINREQSRNSEFDTSIIRKALLSDSFIISRIDVSYEGEGRKEDAIITVKYNKGSWLFSIRSEDGIEALRSFVSNDTVLLNDRLNRKLYQGNPESIEESFGLDTRLLSLLLAKAPSGLMIEKVPGCINGTSNINCSLNGKSFILIYNCSNNKLEKAFLEYRGKSDGVLISYLKYKRIADYEYPGLIEVKIPDEEITLILRISQVVNDQNVVTEFIPGKNYENVIIK